MRYLFTLCVASMVLTTNLNSARADACSGACFDSTTQACSVGSSPNQCNGGSNRLCCPTPGKVSNLASSGIRIEKIETALGDSDRWFEGKWEIHVAWDRNLAEKPVRLGFKTTPAGQVVTVAEGGQDPLMFGTQVNDDAWYVLGEGNHGVLNTCVVIGSQCYGFQAFGNIEVKRDEAPRQNKLVSPRVNASQMTLASLQVPDRIVQNLQVAVAGNGTQLDRIESGVLDLRRGPSAVAMRVLAAVAGGAVIGAAIGAVVADTTLRGAMEGGGIGLGAGLLVGALWSIEW